ncbi:MAG: IclR family transcriptional regulator [Clostridium sp.]|nr:IclR family transcriptional regulator [Clostridium sp.]
MVLTSVDKAMKLMDILAENPKGMRIKEISEYMQISQSSVHHIISTIIPYGYIQQNSDTKKYSLGYRFLSIGHTVLENIDYASVSHPYLEELRPHIEGAIHLSVLKGNRLVYVDKTDWPEGLSLVIYVGFSTEAYAASGGKLLLSYKGIEELKSLYVNENFRAYTERTVRNFKELQAELEIIQKQGYAFDNEEHYDGVRSIAVPVLFGNQPIAALSATGSILTYSYDRMETEVLPLLRGAAKKISKELHGEKE